MNFCCNILKPCIFRYGVFSLILLGSCSFPRYVKTEVSSGGNSSLRGLFVEKDVVLASGSKGTLIHLDSNIRTFKSSVQPTADFRDIVTVGQDSAVLISSGHPAAIFFFSADSLRRIFVDNSNTLFLDDMIKLNHRNALVLADPENGRFRFLISDSTYTNWSEYPLPFYSCEGEAAFAASGSNLALKESMLLLISGGKRSELKIHTIGTDFSVNYPTPLLQGTDGAGAFGMDLNNNTVLIAGGDYTEPLRINGTMAVFDLQKRCWLKVKKFPGGYRSAVAHVKGKCWICTGPSGTDYTLNNGKTWNRLLDKGYNTIRKSIDGATLWLSGNKSEIIRLDLLPLKRR